MVRKIIENFSPAQICDSGQCFRMVKREDNRYSVVAFGRYLEIEQDGSECVFYCGEKEF